MILLVDIGNTRIKWGWQHEGCLRDVGHFVHREQTLPDVLTAWQRFRQAPERVVFCNVAAETVKMAVTYWALRLWRIDAEEIVTASETLGVRNGYEQPARLGVDRWMSLIAACASYHHQAVCVADCGSAVTVDALNQDGQHLGGLIIPGIHLMKKALLAGTQDVRLDPTSEDMGLFARSTYGGVIAGVHYAIVATLDRLADELQQAFPDNVSRIITGGDGEPIKPLLARSWEWRPHLVLEGLALAAEADA
jgi:type III pantothenate kinase